MELRHLRYFVAVAEELHFGRAAQRLQMAQPPLSQQIRQLEQELGVELLYRTKRTVRLTEAGLAFLHQARQILVQSEQAIEVAQRASRGEVGRLAIGFVGSATYSLLPTAVRSFRHQFPDVRLMLHEMTTSEQIEALHDDRIQVGFIRPPISDDKLSVETVLQESFVAVLPEAHPLATQTRRCIARSAPACYSNTTVISITRRGVLHFISTSSRKWLLRSDYPFVSTSRIYSSSNSGSDSDANYCQLSGSRIRSCACPSFTPEFATSRGRLQTARRPNALCQVGNCLAKCKHLARATPISSAIKSRYTI